MMPLTMISPGQTGSIRRVSGSEETRRFLENLGFVAGEDITVLSALGGSVIVSVKDSRVAVNEDMGEAHYGPVEGPARYINRFSIPEEQTEAGTPRGKERSKMTLGEAKVGSTVVVTKIEGTVLTSAASWIWASQKEVSSISGRWPLWEIHVEITVRGYEALGEKK